MDRGAERVRLAGDDRKAPDDAAIGRVLPALPQPGKGEDAALFRHDRIGLGGLAAALLPFVEAVGRDQAAAPLERVLEDVVASDGLAPRVDAFRAERQILGP